MLKIDNPAIEPVMPSVDRTSLEITVDPNMAYGVSVPVTIKTEGTGKIPLDYMFVRYSAVQLRRAVRV